MTICYIEGFSRFVAPPTAAPIATGWSESYRMGFAPTERPCLSTAHINKHGNNFFWQCTPFNDRINWASIVCITSKLP
jgi:hypothetical protein